MKKQTETISVDITLDHYGFYYSDEHFGNKHKPYADWVVKKTGIKIEKYVHSVYKIYLLLILNTLKLILMNINTPLYNDQH